jgi:hypothetical protein
MIVTDNAATPVNPAVAQGPLTGMPFSPKAAAEGVATTAVSQ